MSNLSLRSSTGELSKKCENSKGVSIQGKSLKLDTERDCYELVEEIKACKNLEYLNLEGNTVGVDASKAISKALESKSELKRALWKDMFTGRMKEEIPNALKYLGNGLTLAQAKLTELDLSDNAFGPVGVSGLASLLTSPACYQLQELKLNNNGLGVTGSKMLAQALLQCHKKSASEGKALSLKLLIIGRNRLENEGAAALAEVFQTLGSLEEISMPQNGIYHKGIKALSNAFKKNSNLRVLDLNDNTVTKKGAYHIADALPHLQKLKVLLLEDCLLRNDGATILANALAEKHTNLEELDLSRNEIKSNGGLAIANAMSNKSQLKKLNVDGNQFGKAGMSLMKEVLEKNKRLSALGTVSDDESFQDDDEESSKDEESEEDEEEEEEEEEKVVMKGREQNGFPVSENLIKSQPNSGGDVLSDFLKELSIGVKPSGKLKNFLDDPTEQNFLALKECEIIEFIDVNQGHSIDFCVETFIPLIVKISSLSGSSNKELRKTSLKLTENLYEKLFKWASSEKQISAINNALFIYFGLIKSEDKNFKINWDVKASLAALNLALSRETIPLVMRDTLNLLMDKQLKDSKCGNVNQVN